MSRTNILNFSEKWRKANMAVSKEVKETIVTTIDEVFRKMNSISWLERQKAMKIGRAHV